MSLSELREHASYLTDPVKVDCYRRALQAVVTPGAVVLDLGCGTGLLGLLACEAGAGRVYAVDRGGIIELARQIAAANGYADRIVHLRANSTEVELPEPVDVVVGDQIGGLAYDAGVNEYYADARRRLLRPGGVCVPAAFTLSMAPVEHREEWESIEEWARRDAGFDVSAARPIAQNTQRPVQCRARDLLGPPATLATVAADDDRVIEGTGAAEVQRPGVLHGLLGMFEATMAPGITMTNWPTRLDAMRGRWQNLYPVAEPVTVRTGDTVRWTFRADPTTYLTTWSVTVDGAAGSVTHTGSSFFAGFADHHRFHRASPGYVPAAPERARAWSAAVELMDGVRTRQQIADELAARFPEHFGFAGAAERFVTRVLDAVGR